MDRLQNNNRIVTQTCRQANGRTFWDDRSRLLQGQSADRQYQAGIDRSAGCAGDAEPIEAAPNGRPVKRSCALVKEEMGDRGLVGVSCGTSLLIHHQEEI